MFKLTSHFLLLLLLILPTVPLLNNKGFVSAEEDVIEDEETVVDDEDGEVEDEDDEGIVEDEYEGEEAAPSVTEEQEEEESITASKDADTAIIFASGTDPTVIAGKKCSAYIHFTNRGSSNFIITSIYGSFRYPQDYSYVIQNFTVISPKKMVDAGYEGSFRYDFVPGELSGGRSFGLVINVDYQDAEDNLYRDAVFNQTIQVFENEEGMDTETFFMYVMLVALAALIVVGIYHATASKTKRRRPVQSNVAKKTVETGTMNGPVDLSWIPESTLKVLNKTKTPSPRRSPRKRVNRKTEAASA